jgi:hypothetical protein
MITAVLASTIVLNSQGPVEKVGKTFNRLPMFALFQTPNPILQVLRTLPRAQPSTCLSDDLQLSYFTTV